MRDPFYVADPNPFNVVNDGVTQIDGRRIACEVKSFLRRSYLLNELMEKLMIALKGSQCLCDSLFEVRFLTTKIREAVIVLLYHRNLNYTLIETAE